VHLLSKHRKGERKLVMSFCPRLKERTRKKAISRESLTRTYEQHGSVSNFVEEAQLHTTEARQRLLCRLLRNINRYIVRIVHNSIKYFGLYCIKAHTVLSPIRVLSEISE